MLHHGVNLGPAGPVPLSRQGSKLGLPWRLYGSDIPLHGCLHIRLAVLHPYTCTPQRTRCQLATKVRCTLTELLGYDHMAHHQCAPVGPPKCLAFCPLLGIIFAVCDGLDAPGPPLKIPSPSSPRIEPSGMFLCLCGGSHLFLRACCNPLGTVFPTSWYGSTSPLYGRADYMFPGTCPIWAPVQISVPPGLQTCWPSRA